jgi:hypothetical protein
MPSRSSAALLAAAMLFGVPARAEGEPGASGGGELEAQRERFRVGLERYRAGAYAEAIVVWETVYRELGASRGYRVAFDLARAYEQFGDLTRAAEHYEAFVGEAKRRTSEGETLDPSVVRQENEASARLRQLAANYGRIRVVSERAVAVAIDGGAERIASPAGFVTYVSPGKTHAVGFEPSTPRASVVRVTVGAGELVEVAAPPGPASAPAPTPAPPADAAATPASPSEGSARAEPQPSTTDARLGALAKVERPFPVGVLYASGALTAAAWIVPLVAMTRARSAEANYEDAVARANLSRAASDASSYASAQADGSRYASDYDSARTVTYAATATAAAVGVITVGLVAYWVWGGKSDAPGTVRF